MKWRDEVISSQHGYCGVDGCISMATEVHHRVRNTEVNRRLFPLFIDSPMNLVGLCEACHKGWHKEAFNVAEDMAVLYEAFLKEMSGGTDNSCTISEGVCTCYTCSGGGQGRYKKGKGKARKKKGA